MIERLQRAGAPYMAVGDRAHGMLICILGTDGAGKSTQALRLVARLNAAGYRASYVWGGRKALLTAPLVRAGKASLRAPERPAEASVTVNTAYRSYVADVRRLFKRGLARNAWRGLTLAEHVAQLWQRVGQPLLRGTIVVCDRYIYDTLVNQAVLFGAGAEGLARELHGPAAALVPHPTMGFWLDVPPSVALQRKADVYDIQQLEARAPLYAGLAQALRFRRLDGTHDPDTLADAIWLSVLQQLSTRLR